MIVSPSLSEVFVHTAVAVFPFCLTNIFDQRHRCGDSWSVRINLRGYKYPSQSPSVETSSLSNLTQFFFFFLLKKGNTAGTYTNSAASWDVASTYETLLTSEALVRAAFVSHSFFQLTHRPSHTLPSDIAQSYCVASFWIVSSVLTQCKLHLTVQQGWILRTLLACTVNAAAINPHIYTLTGDNSFAICQTEFTIVTDWWNIHPCCRARCTLGQAW